MYTRKQIAKHNTITDCWVSIDDKVYDLTEFISLHPGGRDIIMKVAGQDATLMFYQFGHSEYARTTMNKYCIGELYNTESVETPLSIVSSRQELEVKKNRDIHNKCPELMKVYSGVFFFLIICLIKYKKTKELFLGYFTAQITFLCFHYLTHVSFITNKYKTTNDVCHIAYEHHYNHPQFMPKYSIVHSKSGFCDYGIIIFILIHFIPYFLLKKSKIKMNTCIYTLFGSYIFHLLLEEPAHDYYHVPYYLKKNFFKGRRLYPEYYVLKLYDKLNLLNQNNHNKHHAHTYKELDDVDDFDDFAFPIGNYIIKMLYKKINSNVLFAKILYILVMFLVITIILKSNLKRKTITKIFLLNIIMQTIRNNSFDDISKYIPSKLNKVSLVYHKYSNNFHTLIFSYDSSLEIEILGHIMFTLPNTNDGYYHNNKENHEMLSMIQRAYTPIEIDNENNTFTVMVKRYESTEVFPEGGKGSQFLTNMKLGEPIDVYVPSKFDIYYEKKNIIFNTIPKVRHPLKNVNIIFGGTGITPFIRLLDELKNDNNINVKVLSFSKDDASICLHDRLKSYEGIKNIFVTKKYSPVKINKDMFITEKTTMFSPCENPMTLICGPPSLLLSTYNIMIDSGYNKSKIIRL